jgi:hypothetical protein
MRTHARSPPPPVTKPAPPMFRGYHRRYFALLKPDAAGKLVEICRSKHISSNLNPSWEPVEVKAEVLGGARVLTLQVWDHDTISHNDLIGEAQLPLPDLHSLLLSGTHRSEVPTLELLHPQATVSGSKKGLAGKRMGTVSGSFVLHSKGAEPGGGGGGAAGGGSSISPNLVAMQTEIEAKAREIAELRSQLGLPRGKAAKVNQTLTRTLTRTLNTQPQPQPQPQPSSSHPDPDPTPLSSSPPQPQPQP